MSEEHAPTGPRLLTIALAARSFELVVWLGLPLVGFVTASPRPTLIPALWLVAAAVPLVLHTLLLNDWAGITTSVSERQRLGLPEHARLDATALAWASVGFAGLGVGLATVRGAWPAAFACLWVTMSVLYSAPRLALKVSVVGSVVVHLTGGIALVLLGAVSAGERPDAALPLALFFALVLVAGSLNHQADHANQDRAGGFRTAAVRFGAAKVARAGFVLFLTAHAWLLGLWLTDRVPVAIAVIFSIPAVVQVACAPLVWRPATSSSTWRTYRTAYRAAFALALVAAAFLELFAGADLVL